MSTIYRQDAIDEIDEWIKAFLENGHKESAADACLIQDGIIQLPSAQPEPSTEIQEILEYLDTTLHSIVSPDNWNVYSELHDMVSKLPSVQQPEIVRCEDCKHHSHDAGYGRDWCNRMSGVFRVKPDDYCSFAERRKE